MFVKLTHAQHPTKSVGMLMAYLVIKFHIQLTSSSGTINMDFMWAPVIHFTQKLLKYKLHISQKAVTIWTV
jgi:hypothetical protein